MFDKWVNQDIGNVLARRNRVVVGAEASLLDLLRKVLPKEMTIFVVHGALEELECKYMVEKFHKDEQVVIIATAPKNELTFIRDYAETCGYVDIRKVESYVAERVFQELGLNISLTPDELRVAAYNSIGKGKEYWEELCREGGKRLFDIGGAIERALNFTDKVSMLSENGAKLVLVPMSNLNELQDLPPSVLGATDVPFYGNNQMLMQKVILGE